METVSIFFEQNMESEVGSSTSKKRTELLKYQSRKRKGKEHIGSTTESPTFLEKTNGVPGTSLTEAQDSPLLPKGKIDVVLALSCPPQSPEKKQKAKRKNKSLALSPNTGTVSRVNSQVLKNTVCEDQNQDVSINQPVEAAAKTDAREQMGTVVRKRRTKKVNRHLMECGTNMDTNNVENKHLNKKLLEEKLDSPGGTKKNKFENTTLWKSLEAASETEGEQEVHEAPQKKRKKKNKEAASQTVDEQELCEDPEKRRKDKSEEAVLQTADKEICKDRQKRRKKKSAAAIPQTVDEQEVCGASEKFRTAKNEEAASQNIDKDVCRALQKRSKKKSKEAECQTVDEQKECEVQQKRRKKKKDRETAPQVEDEREAFKTRKKRKEKRNTETAGEAEVKQVVCEARQTKDEQEVCETQQKRTVCLDAATLIQHEQEICETQQRRKKKKQHADQENNMLLQSMPDITETKKTELENAACEISDSSKICKPVQKHEFLVEQTPADYSTDCKQDGKLSLLGTDNLVEGSSSHTLKVVTEMGSQSLKKKKSKKTSKEKTSHACDVAERAIGDFPTDYNSNVSSLKTKTHVDEICSPIFSATSEQANPSELCKDFDTSSQGKVLAVDNSSAAHPNKKKKHKKDKLKHISHVAVADETNTATLNGCSMEEIAPSTKDDKNDTLMTNDCHIGEIGPSAGSGIDAIMVGTEIDSTSERIAFVDDSSTDLTKNKSATRKNRRKGKSKSTFHEANTVLGLSTLDTSLELPDSYAEGSIATSFDEDHKEQIPPIGDGTDERERKKEKLKHTSQVIVADESNTTALNGCQMGEIVPSTREDRNDTVMAKDCRIEEIHPLAGSKVDALLVGTEIDNTSERTAFIDDSSAGLTKQRSASRKGRRKAKSENTSHEANAVVGLSTLETSLELPDSCAEVSIVTSFNEDPKEQMAPIRDGTDEKKHKRDKLKCTSQATVADETNTTVLNGCLMEEIVLSTKVDKNDTVTQDCQIEETQPSAGSKVDAVIVGTEINSPSEKIVVVDDSLVDLTKKRTASRKKRRKAKSEITSHEASTLDGLSTLETSLELPDSCAEGTPATSFNAGLKDKIPPIEDGKDEVVLKNECEMDDKPSDVDHENAIVIGPTVIDNEVGEKSASTERKPVVHAGRKLLILDLNGLLVDIVSDLPKGYKADKRISRKALVKRPFCDDFLRFCFETFNVAVWSSRTKKNIDTVVDYLFGEMRHMLLFCWDQSHCTETGFNTIENDWKPLVFKELKKLWEKLGHVEGPDLPWEKGEFNESNTLLLDDSPYKGLLNPPHSAVYPRSYMFRHSNDKSLGPDGDIRNYLERVAAAEHVQKFVEKNPFGQHPITSKNPSWKYYLNVIKANKLCLAT